MNNEKLEELRKKKYAAYEAYVDASYRVSFNDACDAYSVYEVARDAYNEARKELEKK
jgi:hypothetical protein